ncbi:MAG TPA: hypothetical protein ENG62_00235 [Thermoplasmatales archaeon]|nr:hypothetical protein [Thermoplasmatales archaeon]
MDEEKNNIEPSSPDSTMESLPLDKNPSTTPSNSSTPTTTAIETPSGSPSNKPVIAGVLLIVAGVLSILTWALFLLGVQAIDTTVIQTLQEQGLNITMEQIRLILNTCATLGIIFSLFPLVGGLTALQKKRWGLALLGGIIGLFTGLVSFLSSILSLVGLILVAISKQDFQ